MEQKNAILAENFLLDKMFQNRGYTTEFLNKLDQKCDTVYPLNTDEMCHSLHMLHESGAEIGFMPDFDMDGITSGVIGFAGLAELGFNVHLYMPNVTSGYGFKASDIDRLLGQHQNVSAILTADVGVSCHEGIDRAKARGLTVLVTDHHQPEGGRVAADVIVDPMQADDDYYNPRICGAHVIYLVLSRYAELYCDKSVQAQIRRLRVFAAMGTVADSMPVYYNNRSLIRDGIAIAKLIYSNGNRFIVDSIQGHPVYRRAFHGLFAVLQAYADAGKLNSADGIDESFFGYYLAPMFNSVKRMEEDIELAFGVFFGRHPENDIDTLMALNNERKQQVAQYMDEITQQDNPFAPYVYVTDASSGLRGLLATKLIQPAAGPCLVVARQDDGSFEGSGRSPFWFNFLTESETYRSGGHMLDAEGLQLSEKGAFFAAGHEQAFGVRFASEQDLVCAVEWMKHIVQHTLSNMDQRMLENKPDFVIAPDGSGDIDLDIMAFAEFLDALQDYRPFGVGLAEPNIMLKFRMGDAEWSTMGKEKQHLRIKLALGFEVLCWNQAFRLDEFSEDDIIHVWGHLNMNQYRDVQTIQFIGSLE